MNELNTEQKIQVDSDVRALYDRFESPSHNSHIQHYSTSLELSLFDQFKKDLIWTQPPKNNSTRLQPHLYSPISSPTSICQLHILYSSHLLFIMKMEFNHYLIYLIHFHLIQLS
jgi:hypothetical protein